jgi:formyl-CoA transferase
VQSDAQWWALVKTSGLPALDDPRFATLRGRLDHQDEIDTALESWTSQRSKEEVEARLKAAGIPAERMRRVNEVAGLPEAEELFRPLEDPPGYTMPVARLPFAMSRSATAPFVPAASPGQHTHAVLQEWLGLDEAECERLEESEVLV